MLLELFIFLCRTCSKQKGITYANDSCTEDILIFLLSKEEYKLISTTLPQFHAYKCTDSKAYSDISDRHRGEHSLSLKGPNFENQLLDNCVGCGGFFCVGGMGMVLLVKH